MMKTVVGALSMAATCFAMQASAQGVNLTGQYKCVQRCIADQPAMVTQNGWNLNLLNEAGQPSRAWVDWPGHIWADSWQQGAVYSPDGMTIQFDRGTVWQRDLGEPEAVPIDRPKGKSRGKQGRPPAPAPRTEAPAPAPRTAAPAAAVRTAAVGRNAYDGSWSVLIVTQSGNCDREYRYGVQISNSNVVSGGSSSADIQGHVAPNGSVWVTVSAGGQRADGQGRMNRSLGTGTWRGQGFGGSCAGTWEATRRG
jgi:hypothetical protein